MSSAVFHRRLDRTLPKAVRSEGVWIEDETGQRYLDASGGPICINVGHGRAEVAEAVGRQCQKLAYVHGPMFTSDPVEELARRLAHHAGADLSRFYFCCSGCEAVETAIKLARQIHLARGDAGRFRLISRWQSYHGATLGALSATGKPAMRQPFLPQLLPVIHIPPPYCYRCYYDLTYPTCQVRCARALEDVIQQEGSGSISAFLAESILGSTIGAVVPPPEYYAVITDICRHHGVLLIMDEVMAGLGRSGRWFGFQHYDLQPDIITLGKGLNGGYVPLSAVGCRTEHYETLKAAGGFVHGHTFSHHAVGAAAGLAVVSILEQEDLISQVNRRGASLAEQLAPLRQHPHVGDIRGIGLMWAIEFVQDQTSRKPFARERHITEKLTAQLMQQGIIVYPCTGFASGQGDAIMLGPPFIITEDEIEIVMAEIKVAMERVFV